MKNIIFDWIRHSVGDSNYMKAVEGIRVMREEHKDMEEPDMYYDFVQELKDKINKGELGGERREMWWHVRRQRLGPITKDEHSSSKVTLQEAKDFMTAK